MRDSTRRRGTVRRMLRFRSGYKDLHAPGLAVAGTDRAMTAMGHRVWAIAEGWIPARSNGPDDMESHETVSFLNTSDQDAKVDITIYFSDREPAGPYRVEVPARRTLHLWFNDLDDPEPIPLETDYASVIKSDVPVVVQHTRLDSRQAENALLTTMAFPVTDREG
jgi:hypothetical protein